MAGSLLPGTSGRTFHLTRDRSPQRVPDPPLDEAALGGGPRLCIGSNLAMIQMLMIPYQRLNSLAPTGPLRGGQLPPHDGSPRSLRPPPRPPGRGA